MISDCKTRPHDKESSVFDAGASLTLRYSPSPAACRELTTEVLRSSFLLEDVLEGRPRLYGTDLDRMIVGGIIPETSWTLPPYRELGTEFFHERRETGILNIGGRGTVIVDDIPYYLDRFDCLYIGAGAQNVIFQEAISNGNAAPAYYFLSCPAHRSFPTCHASRREANIQEIGSLQNCSRRHLLQYIHRGGIQSCQLVMGFTEVPAGSAWNTMPCHVHSRRSEVYFYFDLEEQVVIHLMGEPQNTRHLIIHDRQAVLSPPWSIHCGVGTGPYRFIWGMAGENQEFSDMDPVSMGELR